jgi:UDP-glucose 4-epimerase
MSGNVRLAMSQVVPDLAEKVLKGQDPLRILGTGSQARHYTYGGDLARGIRLCIEHPAATNEDLNLSSPVRTTVLELGEFVWHKTHGSNKSFRYVSDPAYEYDVQERSPATEKAACMLDFHATTSLDDILNEVVPWIAEQIEIGKI